MTRLLLVAVLSALLAFQAYAESSFWRAYREQLFSFLKGGQNTDNLQLLTTPIEATYDLSSSTQKLGDILNPVTKSGPVRELVTPSDFIPLQYYEFLSNIKLTPLDKEYADKINAQKAAVDDAVNFVKVEEERCEKRRKIFTDAGMEMPLNEFAVKYCPGLVRAKQNVSQAEGLLRAFISQAPSHDIRSSLAKMERAVKREEFPWKETYTSLKVFRDRIQRKVLNSFQIVINKSNVKKQQKEEGWETSFEDESFIKNTKGKSFSLSSSSDSFSLNIKATGYYSINVKPDDWFTPNIIDKYRDGPFKSEELAKDFFGEGKLSKIPTTMFLFYKPEITLDVGSEDVEYFRSTPKLKIGPFFGEIASISEVFLGKSSDPEEREVKTDRGYRIVVRDVRKEPLVVAIEHRKF